MTTVEELRATLTMWRNLQVRIDQWSLCIEDKPTFRALVGREVARGERRLAKVLAKAATQTDSEDAGADMDDAERACADIEGEPDAPSSGAGEQASTARDSNSSATESTDGPASTDEPPRGHGRNGVDAYANAEHCKHAFCIDMIGALCKKCGRGRMSRYREKLVIVIKGQPLFSAEIHHFEQVRCRLCGAIIRADGVIADGLGSDYITYEWSACAMLLVMHYFAGMPFKRLESLQAGWGIPMPDANQWDLADASADLLFPLYKALERHGIQNAFALRIDDTGSMVIELRREIRAEIAALEALGKSTKNVRTGINATGVYLDTPQGRVLLFFTGIHHAGEIVDQLLKHRHTAQPGADKLVKVTDAASKNFSHAHHDELEEAVCNAHAYLKFHAVKDRHPDEYALAGEVYKKVFDNDDLVNKKGLSPHERMRFHREHSLPEMKRLHKMCNDKLQSKLVEPNSPLWEPLTFIINQWKRLTKFCEVPGVPLDTNVVEQMLIIPVRYLAGSFNYKNQTGADVGDRNMSLIATANACGVEPVAYLTECLKNHEDLAKHPEHYLPWVYRARLEARGEPMQTCPSSATSNRSSSHKDKTVEHPLRPGTHRGATQVEASSTV